MSGCAPLTVAVLAGGRSSEHDVSLASAEAVRRGLLAGGHEVLWVEIDRDGRWLWHGEPLAVTPGQGLLGADVAFPVLHGPFGEDGTVQGTLETLDVAYAGAGVAASAVCMDKVLFKQLMSAAGVPQVPYRGVRAPRWREASAEVLADLESLGLPVFVKPVRLGSSVGIVRATTEAELPAALETAFQHDSMAIVEAAARGLEVECSVLGASDPIASEPGEIVLATGESGWYDYEAKYSPGGMRLIVPARVHDRVRDRIREIAISAFVRAGCHGLARVDFFVDGEQVLLNELNTMPGFTSTSVYSALFEASGIRYAELLDRLVQLALERHAAERRHRH